jgi:hypothetical protein
MSLGGFESEEKTGHEQVCLGQSTWRELKHHGILVGDIVSTPCHFIFGAGKVATRVVLGKAGIVRRMRLHSRLCH